MNITSTYLAVVRKILPSPLAIALILTLFTGTMAFILVDAPNGTSQLMFVGEAWSNGIWELLEFTMQMVLMLLLGHSLALSPLSKKAILWITSYCNTNVKSAIFVAFSSILMGYVNWGLGLIFGAILARNVGENAKLNNINLNYPLIGACGYLGLLVWHGGLSGSAPLTVAKAGHSLTAEMGVLPISETIFSTANLAAFVAILVGLPLLAFFLAKITKTAEFKLKISHNKEAKSKVFLGADRLDGFKWFGPLFGGTMLVMACIQFIDRSSGLAFFNLNSINFILFAMALMLHGSLYSFSKSAESAVSGTTGIIVQFPLYAGIMGIMKYTGLLAIFAGSFIEISTAFSFPLYAFLSSACVNILVPSGGGQWQIQGPILVQAAIKLGVPLKKVVMALAYGDQLTNMLQPFWALPLLGITGLKAKDILPYSTLFMLLAGIIYIAVLYVF